MPSIFGEYSVRLDPWQIEYGAEVPALAAGAVEDEGDAVDPHVETGGARWEPLRRPTGPSPRRVLFVDGVRRVEARVVVQRGEGYCQGVFGAYGVGCVVVEGGRADFGDFHTSRVVVLGAGESLPEPVTLRPALTYRPVSTASEEPDGPLVALHREMRVREEIFARAQASAEDVLVITDGPLSFEGPTRGAAVGYVKQIMRPYLSGEHLEALADLPEGHRTPLFAIRGSRRFARYSWFLRLSDPRPGDSRFSGLARLETAERLGLERTRELADATAALVPPFAGARGLHARAPQNLLPIAALEARLKRHLGDVGRIHRFIQSFVAEEASHVR